MDYPTALEQLLRHSGLPKEKHTDKEFLHALYLISDKKVFRPVKPLADNILECYEVINKYLNSGTPEATAYADKAQVIDRVLVHAVSDLLTQGRKFNEWVATESGFTPEAINEMAWSVRAIELGWNFVLAGDFDSITKEVVLWNEYGL
ncbi:hypothetical protein [Hymenobacter koreensis]